MSLSPTHLYSSHLLIKKPIQVRFYGEFFITLYVVKRDVLGVLMVPINDEQAIESARIIIDYNDDLSSKPLGQVMTLILNESY